MSSFRQSIGSLVRRGGWVTRRQIAALRAGRSQVDRLPIIFANAIPKSGSTMLFNIARALPRIGPFTDSGQPVIKPFEDGVPTSAERIAAQLRLLRPGDVRCGYLHATPTTMRIVLKPGWANLFMIRDPRDNIVSEVFYAVDLYPGHALHDYLTSISSMEERIEVLIAGIAEGPLERANVRSRYERYLPWIGRPQVHVVRFERVVMDPEATLAEILDFLESFGFESAVARSEAIQILLDAMHPKRSGTFRKGAVGDWRLHFSLANKQLFKETAGDLLEVLGYEDGPNW